MYVIGLFSIPNYIWENPSNSPQDIKQKYSYDIIRGPKLFWKVKKRLISNLNLVNNNMNIKFVKIWSVCQRSKDTILSLVNDNDLLKIYETGPFPNLVLVSNRMCLKLYLTLWIRISSYWTWKKFWCQQSRRNLVIKKNKPLLSDINIYTKFSEDSKGTTHVRE